MLYRGAAASCEPERVLESAAIASLPAWSSGGWAGDRQR